MLIRTWRFLTLMLVALSLAPAFAHLLEMPAKMTYEGSLWVVLLQTLYVQFGTIGAAFEVGAVITSLTLVFMLRHQPATLIWAAIGASCMVVAHAVFWIWVYPVNVALVPASPGDLPPHWQSLRNQWEYAHATRAVLQVVALASLLCSVLVETPMRRRPY
jgi:hypothetical protein